MNSHELELLDAIRDGNKRAMTELYELYFPRLCRFLYRITQNHCLIEELVNDVMVTVWHSVSGFRGESAVSTWILGIAYRKGLDSTRRERRYSEILGQVSVNDPPYGEIAEMIAERDLDRLLRYLTPEQRAVAELAFDFGYSYPEIADILSIPVNTVKTRIYYARQTMQESLQDAIGE